MSDLEAVQRLTRDLKKGVVTLGKSEARYLVDTYYAMQRDRISDNNQERALGEAGEPNGVLSWLGAQHKTLENQIAKALGYYAEADPVGLWSLSQVGIGPIIAAGLLAHIDITKAPTAGHIWRYAGLDPTQEWNKGQKRPWNARLKTLCWKIGESFVKTSGNPKAFYGPLYAEYKARYTAKNEAGDYAEQCAAILARKRFGDDTQAKGHYLAGRLPPAHVHARAKRAAVKLFLAHWQHVAYQVAHGEPPPKPYILTQEGGHAHYIPPPEWPMA